MKKYIKSLAILLTLSLGFTACEEDEVEQVTYANAEEIASWASETAGSKDMYDYNITLYVNAEGTDTLCTFTRIDKKTGNEKYLRKGVVAYDKLAGMTTVTFPKQSGYPDIVNMTGKLYLARHRDMSRMTVQLFKVDNDGNSTMVKNFTAVKTGGFCITEVLWYIDGDKSNKELAFKLTTPNATTGEIASNSNKLMVGGKTYNATYQWNVATGTGSITCDNAAQDIHYHVVLTVNALNQIVATFNGQTYTMLAV